MGKTIVLVGPPGSGKTVKAANQLIVAGTYELIAEAIVFLEAYRVDTQAALTVLAGGLAGSSIMNRKGASMLARQFNPGFRVDLHHKDMGIIVDAARAQGDDGGDTVSPRSSAGWRPRPRTPSGSRAKGRIAVGSSADLVVFAPDDTQTIDARTIDAQAPATPRARSESRWPTRRRARSASPGPGGTWWPRPRCWSTPGTVSWSTSAARPPTCGSTSIPTAA